jgi:hypothetical protein
MKQETLITIKGKPKADERRKGQVVPPRRRDELSRRRTGTFIRYLDHGRLSGGDDISLVVNPTKDVDYYSLNKGIHSVGSVTSSDIGVTVRIHTIGSFDTAARIFITGTDYSTAWNSHALGLDLETLEASYWELTDLDATEYSLQRTGAGDYTPGRGFRVTAAELGGAIGAYDARMVTPFNTAGESLNPYLGSIPLSTVAKVTTDPDYNADAIAFSLTSSADVFLMPKMFLWYGICSGGSPDFPANGPDFNPATYNPNSYQLAEHWFLNGIIKPLPREEFVHTANFDSFQAATAPDFQNVNIRTMNDSLRLWWKGIQTGSGDARLLWWPEDGTLTVSSESPSTFPTSGYQFPDPVATAAMTAFVPFRYPEATLIALIRKGGTWYYVWNTTNRGLAFDISRLAAWV